MTPSILPPAPVAESLEPNPAVESARRLPSGRSVVVKVAGQSEELEIRDPEGQVELSVSLTADGPVIRIRGGRLELDAADAIAVRCRRFEVQSAESTEISSDGDLRMTGREMRVKTRDDIHLNGEVIRLNC